MAGSRDARPKRPTVYERVECNWHVAASVCVQTGPPRHLCAYAQHALFFFSGALSVSTRPLAGAVTGDDLGSLRAIS